MHCSVYGMTQAATPRSLALEIETAACERALEARLGFLGPHCQDSFGKECLANATQGLVAQDRVVLPPRPLEEVEHDGIEVPPPLESSGFDFSVDIAHHYFDSRVAQGIS
jgi:hypothetical protein